MNPASRCLKLVTQLGIRPLLLFGLYRLGLLTGHYRRLDSRMYGDAHRARAFRPIFPVLDKDALARTLSPVTRASIRREADAVVKGKVRLFGDQLIPLRLSLPKHARHWVDYARDASLLSSFSLPHSDIKFLWEHRALWLGLHPRTHVPHKRPR